MPLRYFNWQRQLLTLFVLASASTAEAGLLNKWVGKDKSAAEAPAVAAEPVATPEVVVAAEQAVETLPNVEESAIGLVETGEAEIDPAALAKMGDLWVRMRKGFMMDSDIDNERIAAQRNWYLRNSSYIERMARRATRYLHHTVTEAEKRGLPTELALLPVIESAYDPFAYSHAHAAGMWQFIPGTAKIMGVKQNAWFDGRRDVLESTRAGYDFLTQLHNRFGDWQLALAAYNAGPGAVQRAIDRNIAAGLPTDFWSLKLPAETQAYVPRFLAIVQIIRSPESFGVSLRPVINQPFFRVVNLQGQVDMTEAAEVAGISLKELYQLNPGFNRWATDPEGPHRLLVPASLPGDFETQLSNLKPPAETSTQSYVVRKGDTLFSVARRFGISANDLRQTNNLKSDKLSAGRELVIRSVRTPEAFVTLNEELRIDRSSRYNSNTVRKTYRVRKGETLARVARKHGLTVRQLAQMNGISVRSKVRAGQKLTIQSRSNYRELAKNGKRVAGLSRSGKVKRVRYHVKNGDTLSSISRKYDVSVAQIRRWNGRSDKIRPGQGLVLYVAYNRRHLH